MEDAPEADRSCLGVTAREKMSVRCAADLLAMEELGGARRAHHRRLYAW